MPQMRQNPSAQTSLPSQGFNTNATDGINGGFGQRTPEGSNEAEYGDEGDVEQVWHK